MGCTKKDTKKYTGRGIDTIQIPWYTTYSSKYVYMHTIDRQAETHAHTVYTHAQHSIAQDSTRDTENNF